jgi:hypothetical protein
MPLNVLHVHICFLLNPRFALWQHNLDAFAPLPLDASHILIAAVPPLIFEPRTSPS